MTPLQPTAAWREAILSRPVPLKALSVGDLADLLVAFAAGEMSEGFLRDITGLPGDTVRALWSDAIERANRTADAWISTRQARGDTTGAEPGSSKTTP